MAEVMAFQEKDTSSLNIDGMTSLIQQWNVQWQLQVQPVYECGSNKIYLSAKSPTGSITVGRICTNKLNKKLDVCTQVKASISSTGKCGGSKAAINLQKLSWTGIGYSGQAQQAFVMENVTGMFLGMA